MSSVNLPIQPRPVIQVGMPILLSLEGDASSIPILRYMEKDEDVLLSGFHPFAYVRCNANVVAFPLEVKTNFAGLEIKTQVYANFVLTPALMNVINTAGYSWFYQRGNDLIFHVKDTVEIRCKIAFKPLQPDEIVF